MKFSVIPLDATVTNQSCDEVYTLYTQVVFTKLLHMYEVGKLVQVIHERICYNLNKTSKQEQRDSSRKTNKEKFQYLMCRRWRRMYERIRDTFQKKRRHTRAQISGKSVLDRIIIASFGENTLKSATAHVFISIKSAE